MVRGLPSFGIIKIKVTVSGGCLEYSRRKVRLNSFQSGLKLLKMGHFASHKECERFFYKWVIRKWDKVFVTYLARASPAMLERRSTVRSALADT